MCAINGFNWEDRELAERMNKAGAHRGPDGSDVFIAAEISLGHNRLAIIDLDTRASQPMQSRSRNLTIVYNGELYNFKDLKKELTGYDFRTESDTEVILAAYEKWGQECLKKFNGIFAFAIWDGGKRELFLARDQMGVKPLYYYFEGGKFIFASEIKSILGHEISRSLDSAAFGHYMRLLYTPGPFTLFKSIKKFPQAHYGVLKDGKLSLTRFWNLEVKHPILEASSGALRKVVIEAVERQLVSDRPLGLYLSGGIDSTVVLAALKETRSEVDTFSVGFDLSGGEQSEKFNADSNLARETARCLGSNHHEVFLRDDSLAELLERALWHLDEPIGNATVIPQLLLAQFTRQFAVVALTGDGGDELFGGYPRYKYSKLLDYTPFYHSPAARAEKFLMQKDNVLSRVLADRPEDSTRKFFEQNFVSRDGSITEQFMEMDRQSWLPDEALLRSDKLNMAAGVEARVPLLDREVVQFAATIPLRQKIKGGVGKWILRKAFKNDLPDFILHAPKRGFFSPGAKWLRRESFYDYVCSVLRADYYEPTAGLFNWPNIQKMLEEHKNGGYRLNTLWSILAFQIWAKRFKIVP